MWLRFRWTRTGKLLSHLPDGKVVFADRRGALQPTGPGKYLVEEVIDCGSTAFARLIHCPRRLHFTPAEALSPVQPGLTYLRLKLDYPHWHKRPLPFIFRPDEENLQFLGVEWIRQETVSNWTYLYQFKHRRWRRRQHWGKPRMADDEFHELCAKVMKAVDASRLRHVRYGSRGSRWSAARTLGICTQEDYDEAYRRGAAHWYYAGD